MIKKYIRSLAKTLLPCLIVAFLVCFFPNFLTAIILRCVDGVENPQGDSTFLGTNVIGVFVFLMPLILETYRQKRMNADCFLALPFKPKHLRRIHFLFGLIFLLSVHTLTAIIPNLILYLGTDNSAAIQRTFLSWAIYLLIYAMQYGFFYLFANIGNRFVTSLAIMVCGSFFLACFFPSIGFQTITHSDELFIPFLLQSYTGEALTLLLSDNSPWFIAGLIKNRDIMDSILGNPGFFASFLIGIIVSVLLSILTYLYIFLRKDPDGALAGKPRSNAPLVPYLFLGTFLTVSCFVTCFFSIFQDNWLVGILVLLIIMIFAGVAEYLASFMYLGKAKLNLQFWIFIGSSLLLILILGCIHMAIGLKGAGPVPPPSSSIAALFH